MQHLRHLISLLTLAQNLHEGVIRDDALYAKKSLEHAERQRLQTLQDAAPRGT